MKTFFPSLVALVAAVLAMTLLVSAPTTLIRKERYGDPAGLIELIVLLYQFTYTFFVLSIKDFQHILLILMSVFYGFLLFPSELKTEKPVKSLLLVAIVGILSIFLVAASLTPSAYIERGLPADRTMIIPRFIVVFAFVIMGCMTGLVLREWVRVKWVETAVSVLLITTFAFPVYTMTVTVAKIPIYAQRTQAWDERESDIQAAITNGEEKVDVYSIDGLPIGGIRDFDPKEKKGFWITKCAMDYYDINLRVFLP